MALELERRARSADARVRQVAFADYGDMAAEAAVATSTGITATARRTVSQCGGRDHRRRRRRQPDRRRVLRRTGPGGPRPRQGRRRRGRAVHPDARCHQGRVRAAARSCSTPGSPPRCWPWCPRRCRERPSPRAARSSPTGWAKRWPCPSLILVDDPTDARSFGASTHDAEGLACRRNVLIEHGVLRGFVFDTTAGPPCRGGVDGVGGAGRLRHDPGRRVPGAVARHRAHSGRPTSWPRSERRSSCSRSQACTRG